MDTREQVDQYASIITVVQSDWTPEELHCQLADGRIVHVYADTGGDWYGQALPDKSGSL